MIVDLFMVYQFLKRLSTPFNQWPAFRLGIIDQDGNVLRSRKNFTTVDEKKSFGLFDLLVLRLKKILSKLPGGDSRLANYAAALWLIKEHYQTNLDELNEQAIETLAEEAAANCVGTGNVAGVGIGPQGEPPVRKRGKMVRRNGYNITATDKNNPNQ